MCTYAHSELGKEDQNLYSSDYQFYVVISVAPPRSRNYTK